MKTLCNLIIVMLMATCMLSCASNADTATVSNAELIREIQRENHKIGLSWRSIAKDIVEKDAYIDVDMEALNKLMRDNIDTSELMPSMEALKPYSDEFGKKMAALYRFYSNVSTVDGRMVLMAKEASELNMSERTFNYLKNGIEDFNGQVVAVRSRGFETPETVMPKEYIESFIDDTPRFQ